MAPGITSPALKAAISPWRSSFGGCTSSSWQSSATYNPAGLSPSTTYGFQVKARDVTGNETAASSTALVTTDAPNIPPMANGDAATVAEGGSVVINVVANDTDADGDTLTIIGIGQGANGSVTNNDTTYTPNPGFSGTDTFPYTISDGRGGTYTAPVWVTVTNN